ncbi:type 1 glutamine amidotransferase [Nocardioides bigeumensis]|uniref:Type 1 glutamine amidotransferase n=1 Tax=Nocardioides bigeumensis TaxID=433657 RepID=A0ABN2XK20_9ACTN
MSSTFSRVSRVETAPRILVVEHEADAPPALLGRWLEEAGAELVVCRPYAGDALPDPTAYDAVLVLGGAMGANDDDTVAWIGPTKGLLARAVQERVPTLGLCLGHQLLSAALGGQVNVNPEGHQIGLHRIGWTDAASDDALLGELARNGTSEVGLHWNYDVVVEPPAGSVVLARADRGEVQALRHTPWAWGLQWHPEVDLAVTSAWAEGDHQNIVERGIDREAMLAAVGASEHELTTAWEPLARAFLAVVGQHVS